MKKLILTLVALVVLAVSMHAADVSGTWVLDINPDFGGLQTVVDCTFKQDGERLIVNCGQGGAPITGTVNAQNVTLLVKTGVNNDDTATMTGALSERDTVMIGTWVLTDQYGKREGKFSARKR
jgi:hypothetical protein